MSAFLLMSPVNVKGILSSSTQMYSGSLGTSPKRGFLIKSQRVSAGLIATGGSPGGAAPSALRTGGQPGGSGEGRGGEEGRIWGVADHLKKKKKKNRVETVNVANTIY